MELNRIMLGVGILALLGLGLFLFLNPNLDATGLVSAPFTSSNPFSGKLTTTIENLFRNKPQSIIEQDGRIGILLPGGNSVQFTRDARTTNQDVVIILNARTTKLDHFNEYPTFVENEFTFVPPKEIEKEDPYVRAQYPDGLYLMPVNVE
ncbi:MAG: hypothetical protein Q8P05_00030 [Candidatus Diapherotrites archaeon]|nr:hypothetical protein [Candidatus Diapherotrites archaeon]MDZ4256075.1 hypothetical protein [archaeon]